ncbi:MAG: 2-C-methyl-D-erythritol 4-phosphate cytidylyltransferase, partial [Halomonas sp.]
SALEAMGESPQLISGRRDNIKVTHPDDLALASAILNAQKHAYI